MSELIIDGIDHSVFDLEWATRGGVAKSDLNESLLLYTQKGFVSVGMNYWNKGDVMFWGMPIKGITLEEQAKMSELRMAIPQECEAAGVEYMEPPMRWRSIDSAPKDGREVVLAVKSGLKTSILVGHYMEGGFCIQDHPAIAEGWYFWNGRMFDKSVEPTHWMPLPQLILNQKTR